MNWSPPAEPGRAGMTDSGPLEAAPQTAGPRIPIVLLESGTTLGGTERVVIELARRLDRRRFQPWVVIPPGPALDAMASDLERSGVPV